MQGITKLITILFTKTMAIELTKIGVDSSFLGSIGFLKKSVKQSNILKKNHFSPYFYNKFFLEFWDVCQ